MPKKRNPISPTRKQTDISSFANSKKQNTQRSPKKLLGDKLPSKDQDDASKALPGKRLGDTTSTVIDKDTVNPFSVLSDDDEVMEDVADDERSQTNSNAGDTEVTTNQSSVTTCTHDSTTAFSDKDNNKETSKVNCPTEKDSLNSTAPHTTEEPPHENVTYSRLSEGDKAIADKAKAANKQRKAELLHEYYRQAESSSSTSSSKVKISSFMQNNSPPQMRSILRNPVSPEVNSNSKQKTGLDKSITLKRGMIRAHIHRYDVRLTIKKPKSDDDEEGMVQKALQRFLDIMLQADPHTVIPPYFELDRTDTSIPDLCKEYLITNLDSFASVKRYFSRLSPRNETTGFVYCSVILAQNKPFKEVVEKVVGSICNQDIGVWPKA